MFKKFLIKVEFILEFREFFFFLKFDKVFYNYYIPNFFLKEKCNPLHL